MAHIRPFFKSENDADSLHPQHFGSMHNVFNIQLELVQKQSKDSLLFDSHLHNGLKGYNQIRF